MRNINAFTRDDGTPLNFTLVNIKDWCKNHFEVIHQLRINTDNSHHRYDVILLINGVPCVQIELKTLGVKIPKINRDCLLTYETQIPSAAEQQRIAMCLSSLDALITAETQKLETLKTHKKGLMQQLFPSAAELAA